MNKRIRRTKQRRIPILSISILFLIGLGCLSGGFFLSGEPSYMDLYHAQTAPCRTYWFGTDSMGRDIFSMIWYGGRVSLAIGLLSMGISTGLGILIGTVSGLAPRWADAGLMRMTELFLSVPGLLWIVLLQGALGGTDVVRLAFVIGITSWAEIAKVVRTETKQLREQEYVQAARSLGAGFWRILWSHLAPNFMPSVLFMAVMNLRGAIGAEATLSFMGLGLPLEVVSWGSMLSLSERAMLSGAWWIILIPGGFLVVTLLCVTEVGNWLRGRGNQKKSYL